jgi:hypothetical protein
MKEKIDACSIELAKQYVLSPEQYKILTEQVLEITKEASLSNESIDDIIKRVMDKKTALIQQSERQRLMNKQKFIENVAYLEQKGFKNNAVAALKSLIEPVARYAYKGVGSLWTLKKQYVDRHQTVLDQAIYNNKSLKLMVKGELDRDLFRHSIDGTTNGISKAAIEISAAVKKMQDNIYLEKRRAGVELGYNENYFMKMSHPAEEMSEMGVEEWTKLAKKSFDFEAMGIFTEEVKDEYLDKFYRGRTAELGQLRGTKIMSQEFKTIETSAFSERMGRSRTVKFRSGDAQYDYFKALNPNKTVYSRLITEIDKDAAQIAAMQLFGPNFNAGFKALMQTAKSKMLEKGEVDKFNKAQKTLETVFKGVTQGEFQGKMNGIARMGEYARGLTNMAKLGNALVTTVTDFAFGAAILSKTTGRNFFGEAIGLMADTFKNFVSTEHRLKVAEELSSFANEVNGATMNTRFGEYGRAHDTFGKVHQMYMKATGLPRQAVSAKLAVARRMSKFLAADSHLDFDKLAGKTSLEKFGIDANDWNIMRNAGKDGLITPDTIMDLDDTLFVGMTPNKIMERKIQLGSKIQQWMTFYAERGSPTGGATEFALKNAFDRNTWQGQAMHTMMQYKSFALAGWQTMGHVTWLGAENSKYGDIKALSQTIVTGSAFGALAITAREMLGGKTPTAFNYYTESENYGWDSKESMANWVGFMRDCLLQSGTGGLVFDFFADDYEASWKTLAGKIAGPAVGGIATDITKVTSGIFNTDWTEESDRTKYYRNLITAAERNTPSIPFTRAIINNNVFHAIRNSLDIVVRPKSPSIFDYRQYMDYSE